MFALIFFLMRDVLGVLLQVINIALHYLKKLHNSNVTDYAQLTSLQQFWPLEFIALFNLVPTCQTMFKIILIILSVITDVYLKTN